MTLIEIRYNLDKNAWVEAAASEMKCIRVHYSNPRAKNPKNPSLWTVVSTVDYSDIKFKIDANGEPQPYSLSPPKLILSHFDEGFIGLSAEMAFDGYNTSTWQADQGKMNGTNIRLMEHTNHSRKQTLSNSVITADFSEWQSVRVAMQDLETIKDPFPVFIPINIICDSENNERTVSKVFAVATCKTRLFRMFADMESRHAAQRRIGRMFFFKKHYVLEKKYKKK